jgi:hypothetical protein
VLVVVPALALAVWPCLVTEAWFLGTVATVLDRCPRRNVLNVNDAASATARGQLCLAVRRQSWRVPGAAAIVNAKKVWQADAAKDGMGWDGVGWDGRGVEWQWLKRRARSEWVWGVRTALQLASVRRSVGASRL